MKKDFPENSASRIIKRIRKQESMSVERFADEIGVTSMSVMYWESGKNFPSRKNISKMINKFKVSENDFVKEGFFK